MLLNKRLVVAALLASPFFCGAIASAGQSSNETPASREYFYIGGQYVNTTTGHLFIDQTYVEKLTPAKPCQPYPLVFIHGQAQTGTNWLNKPDGKPGWASFFLKKGYEVYIVDQTERGRSPWDPAGETNLSTYPAEIIEQRFTAPEKFDLWPQAKLHTQWSGTGLMGDPIFDQYYASTVQFQSNTVIQERNMQAAGLALLKKIGPAVLISHSQGGLMPWVIADIVPDLVKAIVAIEPTGPPFRDAVFSNSSTRPWGLTNIPLTYFPAPTDLAAPLQTQVVPSNSSGLVSCIIQASPAKQLANFKNIPVLVEYGEASYHAVYDHCTWQFLVQAGVPAEILRLTDVGLSGNGHLQFLEENSDEIAAVLEDWIKSKVK
ncbi:Alpha/Beta hydrolase protein [Cadophora sp. MPI-SDFR-AT-0126]|nr:Alpha/Beta hydrolase protein [Leotiomycetes sp. MPI-SDFR-AT-0126]